MRTLIGFLALAAGGFLIYAGWNGYALNQLALGKRAPIGQKTGLGAAPS